jgi:hypothetical protein
MIISHLSKSSTTALALTYRILYSICSPGNITLDNTEKEELLPLLEKDLAELYFCHECVKLHRWHGRRSRSLTPWYTEHMPCKRNWDNHILLSRYDTPYYYARLVMNRHFYGPAHGPCPNILDEQNHSYYHSDGIVESVSQQARIVDDQLMVTFVNTMHHSHGEPTMLRRHIYYAGQPICTHLTLAHSSPTCAPIRIPELARDGTTSSLFIPCHQTFGSCSVCLTNYSIEISQKDEERGYVIEVQVYRQLGDCRSPLAWSWRTTSIRHAEEEPRKAYEAEYRPGCVRDRWN